MPYIALADVAVIAFALIAMLAIFLLAKVAVAATPDIHIPLVGNLKDKVNGAFQSALNGIAHVIDASLGLLPKALHWTTHLVSGWAQDIAHVAVSFSETLSWFVVTFVPREIHKASAYLDHKIATLAVSLAHHVAALSQRIEARAAQLVTRIDHEAHVAAHALAHDIAVTEHKIAGAITTAEKAAKAEATALFRAAEHDATRALATARSDLLKAVATAEAATAALAKTLTTDIGRIDSQIENLATVSIPAVLGALGTDIDSAVSGDWDELTAAVAGATAAAAGGFADVTGWLGAISTTAINDIAGLSVLSVATAGALASLAEDCIIPNCRNLGGLGALLKDVLGLVEDGALLAFIAEVASNPEGAASDIESILGPIASSTSSQLLGLVNA